MEATKTVSEPMVAWDVFLVMLAAYGLQGADDPLVWEVLEELGLADRDAFTGTEMHAIERAIAERVQLQLSFSNDPAALKLQKLIAKANRMVDARRA